MIVGGRRHYGQGRQIESLNDCVAGDDVDRVEVKGAELRSRVGRMGQGSSAQASGLNFESRKRLPFASQVFLENPQDGQSKSRSWSCPGQSG